MYNLDVITNWYAQGMIIGISLAIIAIITSGFENIAKRLLSAKNPLTRYISFYSFLFISLVFTVFITYYFVGVWSHDLITKPLSLAVLFALFHSFFVIRRIRHDKERFITKVSHIISFQFADLSKSLEKKTDKIKSSWAGKGFSLPPGMMFGEIKEEYISAMSLQAKLIWDILITELKRTDYVITVKVLNQIYYNTINRYLTGLENGLKFELSQMKGNPQSEDILQAVRMTKESIAKRYDPNVYFNHGIFAYTP